MHREDISVVLTALCLKNEHVRTLRLREVEDLCLDFSIPTKFNISAQKQLPRPPPGLLTVRQSSPPPVWLLYRQRTRRGKGTFLPLSPHPSSLTSLGEYCVVINVPHKSPPHTIIPSSN